MNRRELLRRLAAGILGAPVIGRMSLADTPFEAIPGAILNKDQRSLLQILHSDFVAVEVSQEQAVAGHPTTWVTYAQKGEFPVGLDDLAYDMIRHATPTEFQLVSRLEEEIDVSMLGSPLQKPRYTVKVRYVG